MPHRHRRPREFRTPTALALIALLLLALPHAAACERLPKPSISIKRIDDPVRINLQFGYKAINNLASTIRRPGQQVLGLTRGNAVARFALSLPSVVAPGGNWECASPQIVMSFGFSPMTVYVAREFPPGSCAHKEIYEHELRHVRAYQEHLAAIEKDIAETLTRRFATGDVWRGPAGETRDRLQREIDERWLPYVQREIRRAEAAQALIDTPEEYARVADSCNGEIRKRLP